MPTALVDPAKDISSAIARLDEVIQRDLAIPVVRQKRSRRREQEVISTPALLEILSSGRRQQQQQQQQYPTTTLSHRKRRRRSLSIVLANSALQDTRIRDRIESSWRPFSLDDLLDRVASYTLSIWNDSKPAPYLSSSSSLTGSVSIDPSNALSGGLAARSGSSTNHRFNSTSSLGPNAHLDIGVVKFARYGWKCSGKKREEVTCVTCERTWTCENVKDWRSEEGRRTASMVQNQVVNEHSIGCPWRHSPCSTDLYRLPLYLTPAQLRQQFRQRCDALLHRLDFDLGLLQLKSPLTDEEYQAIAEAVEGVDQNGSMSQQQTSPDHASGREVPSSSSASGKYNAVSILALFGWEPFMEQTASQSTERRKQHNQAAPTSTEVPQPSRPSRVIQCKMCCRRVLLATGTSQVRSSVTPSTPFIVDVKTSHRKFCPYIRPVSDSSGVLQQQQLQQHALQQGGGESDAGATREGWQVLLARISRSTRETNAVPFFDGGAGERPEDSPQTTDAVVRYKGKTASVVKTREAVEYVRGLLSASRSVKRKGVLL